MPDEMNQTKQKNQTNAEAKPLRSYKKPVLEELGDLRSNTLAFSNSVGESGNEGTRGDFPIG